MSHVPTVDEVMADCYVSNGFYEWREDASASLYDAATLRPALDAAYDASMPNWVALVYFPTYKIEICSDDLEWVDDHEFLGLGSVGYNICNRWSTRQEALDAVTELVEVHGCPADRLRVVAVDD